MEATGPDSFSLAITMLKAGGALLLIVGLLVLLMIALRKLGLGTVGRRTGGLVRVVESIILGPRKSLAVVEAAGEYLLLGITDQQITILTSLPAEEIKRRLATAEGTDGRAATFAGILAGAVKRRPAAADSESTVSDHGASRRPVAADLATAGRMDTQEAVATSEAGRMPAENELRQAGGTPRDRLPCEGLQSTSCRGRQPGNQP